MIFALGLVPAIFSQDTSMVKLLSREVSFLSDEAWQDLDILATLRSINSGVHEIQSGISTCCP
jgi:hypothetical protein